MTFFYDINKKLADIAHSKQQLNEHAAPAVAEAAPDYSAKKAAAGKDIGKPGKQFAKIAKSAAERYGSAERGRKVAGAMLRNLRDKQAKNESKMADQDYDEDGKIETGSEEYLGSRDRAIKKAMGKNKSNKLGEETQQWQNIKQGAKDFGMGVADVAQGLATMATGGKVRSIDQQRADAQRREQMAVDRAAKEAGAEVGDRYHNQLVKTNPAYRDEYMSRVKDVRMPDTMRQIEKELQAKYDPMGGPMEEGTMEEGAADDFLGGDNPVDHRGHLRLSPAGAAKVQNHPNYDPNQSANAQYSKHFDQNGYKRMTHDQAVEVGKHPEYNPNLPANAQHHLLNKSGNMQAMKEEVKTTARGRIHKAGAGGYGRKFDTDEEGKEKDNAKPVAKTPAKVGRPSGKDTHDTEELSKIMGMGQAPKASKAKGTKIKKADVEPEERTKPAPMPLRSAMTKRPTKYRGSNSDLDEGFDDVQDQGEYGQEGDMAKDQLYTLTKAAAELSSILDDDQDLPEWVQSKITKALEFINTSNDYMDQERHDSDDMNKLDEEPKSKNQAIAARIARGVQKGEVKAKPGSASAEMAKMKPKELNKFAKGSTKGLPKKVSKKKEEVEETTTTAGAVSTAPTSGKAGKGGMQFGKGIYDSWNRELEQVIAESMNISMNMNSDSHGGPGRSLTVTATDEDAGKLAELLKMAGIGSSDSGCGCGSSPCSCSSEEMHEEVDENSPDWPTNTETSHNALQYAGGLNKPKTDVAGNGQTTVPVTAVHSQSQDELRRMMEMAGLASIEEDNINIDSMTRDEVNAALKNRPRDAVDDMTSDEVNAALKNRPRDPVDDMSDDEVNAAFNASLDRIKEMAGLGEGDVAPKPINPFPIGQDALSPQEKLNPPNANVGVLQGLKRFIMNPTKGGMEEQADPMDADSKPRDPASQQIPLTPHSPDDRVGGPKHLSTGQPTGTENYDDDVEIFEQPMDEASEWQHAMRGIKRFVKGKPGALDTREKYAGQAAFANDPVKRDQALKRMDRVQGVIDRVDAETMGTMKEESKPDYIDLDRDGNKKESMKQAAKDAEHNEIKESLFNMNQLWKPYRG